MTSMKIVQFSRPPTPLVHLHPKFFHPLDRGRPISNDPSPLLSKRACERTKSKQKQNTSRHVTFKLTALSILRFSPTNNAIVSLKDDFTV